MFASLLPSFSLHCPAPVPSDGRRALLLHAIYVLRTSTKLNSCPDSIPTSERSGKYFLPCDKSAIHTQTSCFNRSRDLSYENEFIKRKRTRSSSSSVVAVCVCDFVPFVQHRISMALRSTHNLMSNGYKKKRTTIFTGKCSRSSNSTVKKTRMIFMESQLLLMMIIIQVVHVRRPPNNFAVLFPPYKRAIPAHRIHESHSRSIFHAFKIKNNNISVFSENEFILNLCAFYFFDGDARILSR